MGLKKKSPKGEIGIDTNNGRIRLRWRYAGERYSLNLPYAYLLENLHHATLKATEIKLDMAKGCFDSSLEKYNPVPVIPTIPKAQPVPEINKPDNSLICLDSLVQDFNNWGKNIRNVDVDNAVDYLYVRRLLEKWDYMKSLTSSPLYPQIQLSTLFGSFHIFPNIVDDPVCPTFCQCSDLCV